MESYHQRSGYPLAWPILVIVSGAPGSGKTTMAARIATEMRLPHLNRDIVRDGLWMTDGDDELIGTNRAWNVWLEAVTHYIDSGVSIVIDQTLYRGLSDVTLNRELVPRSWAVNVHLVAENATARWEARVRADLRGAPHVDAGLVKVHEIQSLVRDPLDFECPQITIDTTDPDVPIEPLAERIWDAVVELNASAVNAG